MSEMKSELRVLEGLVLFALGLAIVATILSIPGPFAFGGEDGVITRSGERIEVAIPDRCDVGALAGRSGEVTFDGVCRAEVEVGASAGWAAPARQPAFALARIGTGVLAAVVLFLLLRIVRTIRAGDPFLAVNAGRTRAMGVLVMAGGMTVQFVRVVAEMRALDRIDALAPGLVAQRDMELSFLPIAAGLLLVGLAEVFRQGARLREDVEGLV